MQDGGSLLSPYLACRQADGVVPLGERKIRENRSYDIEKPKEVIVPSVYDGPESNDTTDNYDIHYNFDTAMLLTDQAKESNYPIRFGEEDSANTENQDSREFVIHAHGYHGDFEVYKYGLDIDRLQAEIKAPTGTYRYGGWDITQEAHDPLKDYYETNNRGEEGVEEIGRRIAVMTPAVTTVLTWMWRITGTARIRPTVAPMRDLEETFLLRFYSRG